MWKVTSRSICLRADVCYPGVIVVSLVSHNQSRSICLRADVCYLCHPVRGAARARGRGLSVSAQTFVTFLAPGARDPVTHVAVYLSPRRRLLHNVRSDLTHLSPVAVYLSPRRRLLRRTRTAVPSGCPCRGLSVSAQTFVTRLGPARGRFPIPSRSICLRADVCYARRQKVDARCGRGRGLSVSAQTFVTTCEQRVSVSSLVAVYLSPRRRLLRSRT